MRDRRRADPGRTRREHRRPHHSRGDSLTDQFLDRIDATPLRDGDYIGRGEVRVVAGSNERQRIERLQDECDRLRDRVAELTRLLAEARAS
jgi:hypothetical protein